MAEKPTPITDEEIARDLAVCDAATGGPWYTLEEPWIDSTDAGMIVQDREDPHGARVVADFDTALTTEWAVDDDPPEVQDRANAAFAVAARTGWPRYIRELARIQKRLAQSRPVIEAAVAYVDALANARALPVEDREGSTKAACLRLIRAVQAVRKEDGCPIL